MRVDKSFIRDIWVGSDHYILTCVLDDLVGVRSYSIKSYPDDQDKSSNIVTLPQDIAEYIAETILEFKNNATKMS
jgi:hypothetical protein